MHNVNIDSQITKEFFQKGYSKPIIDAHGHMHPFNGGHLPKCSPEAMIDTMDIAHIAMISFCSHTSLFDANNGSKAEIEAVNKYPKRLKAYYPIVSLHFDIEKMKDDFYKNPDVYVGAKFLCDYYNVALNDKRHDKIFEFLQENNLLVLSHTWGGSPYDDICHADDVLNRYPDLTFFAGHSFYGKWQEAVALAHKHKNLYLELTAVNIVRGVIEYFANEVGAERLLFGTDLPWFSPYSLIGPLLESNLTDSQIEAILYKNMYGILSRFDWFKETYETITSKF